MKKLKASVTSDFGRFQRRYQLFLAALVGVVAGLITTAYLVGVTQVDLFTLEIGIKARQSTWLMVGIPAISLLIGCFAGWLTTLCPEASGGGTTGVRTMLLGLSKIKVWPLLPVKFFAGLLSLLCGMSLGAEGPSVHLGAIGGQIIGDAFKVSQRKLRPLVAAGTGAGLAAAFNAPLTGFVYVLEEMRKEMSALTFGTALIASVTSVGVLRVILGQEATFHLNNPGPLPLKAIPIAALIGLGGAFIGIFYNRFLTGTMEWRVRKHISMPLAGAIIGLAAGIILIFLPQIAGSGHIEAKQILTNQFNFQPIFVTAFIFCILKLIFTVLSYSTGVPGGIFAPLIVIGGFWGLCVGSLTANLIPMYQHLVPGFAAIGMAAVLVGSVRAPLTATILVVEITGEYGLLFSLLVCAFVAYAVAEALGDTPIYDSMLERFLHGKMPKQSDSKEPILTEFIIEPESKLDGIELKDLDLPGQSLVIGIDRNNRQIIPNGSTQLFAGDLITIVIDPDHPSDVLLLESLCRQD